MQRAKNPIGVLHRRSSVHTEPSSPFPFPSPPPPPKRQVLTSATEGDSPKNRCALLRLSLIFLLVVLFSFVKFRFSFFSAPPHPTPPCCLHSFFSLFFLFAARIFCFCSIPRFSTEPQGRSHEQKHETNKQKTTEGNNLRR